jgi:hypothetical protein
MRTTIALLLFASACTTTNNGEEEVGTVQATIQQVPPAVSCVKLLAVGSRTVSRAFDVIPGQMTTLNLPNLPVGDVTFSGAAYQNACAAIAGTTPSWTAASQIATIFPGSVTPVTLTMRPSGGASVGVDFDDDGGTPNDGGAPADLFFPPPTDLFWPPPTDLFWPPPTDLFWPPPTDAGPPNDLFFPPPPTDLFLPPPTDMAPPPDLFWP